MVEKVQKDERLEGWLDGRHSVSRDSGKTEGEKGKVSTGTQKLIEQKHPAIIDLGGWGRNKMPKDT